MKRALIVLLVIVGAGAGLILWREAKKPSKRQVGDSEASAPPVALIRCGDQRTVALTRTVRPQADGIHLVIQNSSDDHAFYLSSPEDGSNQGGFLDDDPTTAVLTSMPPGDLSITCHKRGQHPASNEEVDPEAHIEIVDPEDLWTSPVLECGEGEQVGAFRAGRTGPDTRRSPAGEPIPRDPAQVMRRTVPGVKESDVLVRPGYPQTGWHGEPRLVLRDGQALASLTVWQANEHWEVVVWRCPGSDIGR